MNNQEYWVKRAEQRMQRYVVGAERIYNDIAKAYHTVSLEIEAEIKKVFQNFVQYSGVSENEAKRLLQSLEEKPILNQLREIAYRTADQQKRQELLNVISAPAYSYRIQRWDNLKHNIDLWIGNLQNDMVQRTNTMLEKVLREAYYHSIFDLQQGTGIGFSFALFPESRIRRILEYKWSGSHYSSRIWENTSNLAVVLKQELLSGFLTGRSYANTAKRVQEAMSSGAMQAKRLVCTEANYIANQAELEGYRASGVEWYLYSATLDLRTSEVCRKLDGKRYRVDQAQPGRNFPPMHPWCRSTTIAYINNSLLKQMRRSARDPETGKIIQAPGNMNYEQWYKKYVEGGTV